MNFNNNEFTLLSKEQIFGSEQIDVIKNMGGKCAITDFAILLGAHVSSDYHVNGDNSMKGRTCRWYLSSSDGGDVDDVYLDGDPGWAYAGDRSRAVRPVLPYTNISDIFMNGVTGRHVVLEVEYGEYPQYAVDTYLCRTLDNLFQAGVLRRTGKTYTTDSKRWDAYSERFSPVQHEEFEYNGKYYVRVKSNDADKNYKLSNGVVVHPEMYVWIEVSPIKWIVDDGAKILVSKTLLASGIRFCDDREYNGDFKNTEMYEFLNTYFAKDIIPSNIKRKEKQVENIYNPYNFDFSEVSEEDILRGCIESNTAVMLHGESGDGKSARVKELDKDAVVVYMLTQGLDSFAGKSVLINNELVDIPPTWYTKLKSICDEEPDKLHIVFFDEIANAPPSVQAMAFNVVLEHEINGKWKLPKNARVVAAMNEMTESRSSYGLSEPLYNRFAHVYIKTSPNDWLKWAISEESDYQKLEYKEEIKRKIHPSIYAYISYNSDALRTKYTGISPNADPRKWEMASKVLYTTNNPNMIRSLVGEEVTADFINFCTSKVITIEDVLTGNYTDEDLKLTTSSKYNTVVALSKVDIEHFEIIREFTKKLGSEMVSLLDTLWTHNDDKKLEILAEVKLAEKQENSKR